MESPDYSTTSVNLVVITGPSPTTAKARCLIDLDGFTVTKYGHRPVEALLERENDKSLEDDSTPTQSRRVFEVLDERAGASTTPSNTWEELRKAVEEDDNSSVSDTGESEEPWSEGDGDLSFQSLVSTLSNALSSVSIETSSLSGSELEITSLSGESSRSSSRDGSAVAEERRSKGESRPPTHHRSQPIRPASHIPSPTRQRPLNPASYISPSAEEKDLRDHVRTVSLAMASGFDFNRDDIGTLFSSRRTS